MFRTNAQTRRLCPEIGVEVKTGQKQAECKKCHNCETKVCPLEQQFQSDPIDFQIAVARFARV